jgi:hypothetical protein
MAENIHDPYNHNSTPDYDEWGWDTFWSLNDWLTWHNSLIKALGQPLGNDRFVQAWNARTGLAAFGDIRANWLTDTSFRNYLKGYKTTSGQTMLDAILAGDPINQVLGWAVDLVSSSGNAVTNAADAVGNTTNTLKYLLPILLVVAAGTLIFIIYKSKTQIT